MTRSLSSSFSRVSKEDSVFQKSYVKRLCQNGWPPMKVEKSFDVKHLEIRTCFFFLSNAHRVLLITKSKKLIGVGWIIQKRFKVYKKSEICSKKQDLINREVVSLNDFSFIREICIKYFFVCCAMWTYHQFRLELDIIWSQRKDNT